MLKKIAVQCITFLCQFFSKSENKIVYHSFPDFSDNSFAAFVYASNNLKTFRNIWLVDNYESKVKYMQLTANYTNNKNFTIIKKKSILGFFHYFTANIIFHTHGLYNFLGLIPKQKKINLWHGMPIKRIGYLDDPNHRNVQKSNFNTATSEFYQHILAKAFRVSEAEVLILGQIRNDFLFTNKFTIHNLFDDNNFYTKTILWMPTYRKSIIGDIRLDGEIDTDNDFFNEENLMRTNVLLKRNNAMTYVKLHPMDFRTISSFKTYSNIRFINNSSFEDKGINMYSTFKSVDILLTDFSSIYIDFLLLDRPIGFVFSDFEAFKNSRGFLFSDPLKFMPGEIITTMRNLEEFLTRTIVNNEDDYTSKRSEIKNKFHKHDDNFSKILFDKIMTITKSTN